MRNFVQGLMFAALVVVGYGAARTAPAGAVAGKPTQVAGSFTCVDQGGVCMRPLQCKLSGGGTGDPTGCPPNDTCCFF